MRTAIQHAPANGVNTRQLWAAVTVLGIVVVALGASLIHIQTRPLDGHTALAALDPPKPHPQAVAESESPLPVTTVAQGETLLLTPPALATAPPRAVKLAAPTASPAPLAPPVPQRPIQPATNSAAVPPALLLAPAPVVIGSEGSAPMVMSEAGLLRSDPVPAPNRAVCASCGRVESVSAIERPGQAQGVGAVAGGVLGAVLGNQVGKGNGRAIATVLGAVGGGVAGNAIERNTAKAVVYQVQVRMEDGSLRMVEQASAPAIGSAVTVEGEQMRPAPLNHGQTPAPAPQEKTYSTDKN